MTTRNMSLLSATALVISSQVGSAIFLLPASLAALGPLSLGGWILSGSCALLLAFIFANLCRKLPKRGGAPVYVEASFGPFVGFLTGWTYWLVYSISNTAVLIAAAGSLTPLLKPSTPLETFCLEVMLLSILTGINLRGVMVSATLELILTILKCVPLLVIPVWGLFKINGDHFWPLNPHHLNPLNLLSQASFLTLWGFIGLEAATAATRIIPQNTAAKAVMGGTLFVVALYVLNSVGLMALIPGETLARSSSPYGEAIHRLMGQGAPLIAVIAFISCLATVNAGVLAGGQIAHGAAHEKTFPALFAKLNQRGAPEVSLFFSFVFIVLLLLLTLQDNFIPQLEQIMQIAIVDYLLIYLLCIASFLLLNKTNKLYVGLALIPLLFFGSLLASSSLSALLYGCLPVISGVPLYWWQKTRQQKQED